MSFVKAKMDKFNNEKFDFDKYINNERKKNKYDPRPDLEQDHKYWKAVLEKAEQVDRQLYGNLHGFRIAGCRLKLIDGQLKLKPENAINNFWDSEQKYKEYRNQFLVPYQDEIIEIFQSIVVNNVVN